jgi:hypothetical protein
MKAERAIENLRRACGNDRQFIRLRVDTDNGNGEHRAEN